MRETPYRRFNLGDAMAMIAAITPSLVLIRVGVRLGLFEIGKLTETGGRSSPLARQLVEFFNVVGGCILAGLVPAVLILGLYRAHPSRRDAARDVGLVTCFVAIAASILPILWFAGTVLVESQRPYPVYSVAFNNAFGRWMIAAGPMILGAWITLAMFPIGCGTPHFDIGLGKKASAGISLGAVELSVRETGHKMRELRMYRTRDRGNEAHLKP